MSTTKQQFNLESNITQGENFDSNSISLGGREVLLGDPNLRVDNK